MNKGGGEKARAERAAREGGGRGDGGRGRGRGRGGGGLRKGAPKIPTPSAPGAGTIQVLNTRISVPGEPPPLPPRRAEPREGASPPSESLRGWRGFTGGAQGAGGNEFDGLGIVPGALAPHGVRGGDLRRSGAAAPDMLHMAEDAQDAVSALLRELRPPELPPEDEAAEAAKAAAKAVAAATLAAPARVRGAAMGMTVEASLAGRASLFASADAVLDQLAAQEVHAVARAEEAARAGLRRAASQRKDRDRRVRSERLRQRIVEKGFAEKWADEALKHCVEDEADFEALDAAGEPPSKAAQRAAVNNRLAAAMDWLCIHVPRDDMPGAFLSLSEAQLAPVPGSAAAAEAAAAAAAAAANAHSNVDDDHAIMSAIAPSDPYVALLQRAMLGRLQAMGFSRPEAREALEAAGWIEEDATYALLRSIQPKEAEEGGGGGMSAAEVAAERGEEALALEAIFESAFKNLCVGGTAASDDVSENSGGQKMWTVDVASDDDRWKGCVLEVHFPPGNTYPAEPPLLSVQQPNLPPPIRRSIAAQLAAQAASLAGEAVVFTLVAWLQEHLPAILDEHGEMDAEAVERAAAEAAAAEAEKEEAATAAAKATLSGQSHIERTFAKLDRQREEDAKEEAERRKRMAYYRSLLAAEKENHEEEEEEEDDDEEEEEEDVEGEDRSAVGTTAKTTVLTASDDGHDGDGEDGGGGGGGDEASVAPSSAMEVQLQRWEAEHRRRVEAAKAATDAAAHAFAARRIIMPNTVVTAEAEAAAKAKAEAEAREAAAAAKGTAEMETAKGRRARAREKLYATKVPGSTGSGGQAGGSKPGVSWLTQHVKNLGWGEEERGAAAEAAHDDVAAAAAATLAGVSLSKPALTEADLALEAAQRKIASTRLAAAEKRKEKDPKWRDMQAKRRELPAFSMREEVLECIESGRAAVVSGATGCGKTTQVPQFVFENAVRANKGGECSVIITQPRRLSAIAVAERVAAERCERIGDTVGYSIRLESKQSANTRLLFCTTGILLRRLQSDPDLRGVSHVIVDEVHERDLLSDFLLVILRRLAARRVDPPFRLVAMSATVNAELFQTYFEKVVPGPCACVEIPGRTFPVAEYRLEDAIEATGYVCEPDSEFAIGATEPGGRGGGRGGGGGGRTFNALSGSGTRGARARAAMIESLERTADLGEVTEETRAMYPGYSDNTLKCLQTVDEEKINMELIELLVAHIADEYEDGAILVFLPGMAEIRGLHERLAANLECANERFILIPLHSTLSSEEQRLTFSTPPPGVRKVVMATNIAETSITIDDVVFVIDSGRVRETQYDPASRMSSLVTAWCSRASSRQRRGRAGRVREGYCFHLYSSKQESALADFTTPEILRTPLDALCLQIKVLRLGDVREFLAQAIEPPPEGAIASALRSLMELDAVDVQDELTPLGHHLAELPVDARLGKMMLYGAMFSCLDPVLTIAAGVGFRSPFVAPIDKRDEADEAKRKLAGPGATSDHLTLVRAYAGWIRARARGRGFERDFLAKTFLSAQTLRQISEMRQQYVELLDQIGFLRSGTGLLGGGSAAEQGGGEGTAAEGATGKETGAADAAGAARGALHPTATPFVPSAGAKPKRTAAPEPTDVPDDARGASERVPGTGKTLPEPRGQGGRASSVHPDAITATSNPAARVGKRATRAAAMEAALRSASVNAGNEPLVRAVICAGLFPNVAVTDGRTAGAGSDRPGGHHAPRRVVVRTKGDGEVSLHPTSICFGLASFEHRFLLFHEKVRTTKVYIRDATMVGAYPLLLFGGKVKVHHERAAATCDNWIHFRAAPRVAVLFKALRTELDGLLMQKIATPDLNIAAKSGDLVRTIVELLETESAVAAEARRVQRRADAAAIAASEGKRDAE